jgi:hypothetical protein
LAHFWPWRWRCYFPSKLRLTYGLHGAMSQKMATVIVILHSYWRHRGIASGMYLVRSHN